MAFSQKQTDAINAWVAKHNPKCPVCQQSPPGKMYLNFISLSEYDPSGSARMNVQGALCFGLVCSKCGHVMLVDIQEAHVPKDYK